MAALHATVPVLLALVCGGCGTLFNAMTDPTPFGGVVTDTRWMSDLSFENQRFLVVLDFPGSLALDTALLPFTTFDWLLAVASAPEPEAPGRTPRPEEPTPPWLQPVPVEIPGGNSEPPWLEPVPGEVPPPPEEPRSGTSPSFSQPRRFDSMSRE